jgi:cholesterol transport system auxiliary component
MGAARWIAMGAISVALSACTSSLLETDLPPSSLYVIAPAPAPTMQGAELPVDLSIGRPDVAPGLDTNRIAVLKGRQLDYYRAARWGGSTTEVVQTFLVDSLEDQRLFRSVTAEQVRVAGDYVLDVEVRDFQAEYAGDAAAPSVRVKMIGRLIRVVDRELAATLSAEANAPASDNRMHAVAAAFESAAHKVATELARQAASAVSADIDKSKATQ